MLEKELNETASTKNQETSILRNETEYQTSARKTIELQLKNMLTIKREINDRNGRFWPVWVDKMIFHQLVVETIPIGSARKNSY